MTTNEKLNLAVQVMARVKSDIKRRLSSDDACGHPFDEDLAEALIAVLIALKAIGPLDAEVMTEAERKWKESCYCNTMPSGDGSTRCDFCESKANKPDASQAEEPQEHVQFETSWGRVKCEDGAQVWFPRFFGESIAGKIKGRKTFVTLTFDKPLVREVPETPQESVPTLAQLEAASISRALSMADGSLAKAASALGLNKSTLYMKVKEYGLRASSDMEPLDVKVSRDTVREFMDSYVAGFTPPQRDEVIETPQERVPEFPFEAHNREVERLAKEIGIEGEELNDEDAAYIAKKLAHWAWNKAWQARGAK